MLTPRIQLPKPPVPSIMQQPEGKSQTSSPDGTPRTRLDVCDVPSLLQQRRRKLLFALERHAQGGAPQRWGDPKVATTVSRVASLESVRTVLAARRQRLLRLPLADLWGGSGSKSVVSHRVIARNLYNQDVKVDHDTSDGLFAVPAAEPSLDGGVTAEIATETREMRHALEARRQRLLATLRKQQLREGVEKRRSKL